MGGRKPTVEDEVILSLFTNTADPVLATSEVKEAIGFSTNKGALDRLNNLEDRGLVDSKKIGRSLAWWITDRGRAYLKGELGDDELKDN